MGKIEKKKRKKEKKEKKKGNEAKFQLREQEKSDTVKGIDL